MSKIKYVLRHPLRALLRVDCGYCVGGDHRSCEIDWPNGCYCRIIRGHA